MRRTILNTASLLVLAAALTGVAQAADLPVYTKAPAPVVEAQSPWMIRLRALGVIPDGDSPVYTFGAPLSTRSGLDISQQVVPELDISYFFTENLAAELILGVTRHSITGQNTLAGVPIGKSTLLPPTLTIQYHFTSFGAFKPYIGVGVNYTTFFDTKAANVPGTGGLAVTGLSIGDSWGAAAQFGFDYMLDRHWGINVDVKKLWLRPEFSATTNVGVPVVGTAHIDPWLVGAGITYRF